MCEARAIRHIGLRPRAFVAAHPPPRLRGQRVASAMRPDLLNTSEPPTTKQAEITHLHAQRGLQERAHAEAHHVEGVIVVLEVLPAR